MQHSKFLYALQTELVHSISYCYNSGFQISDPEEI